MSELLKKERAGFIIHAAASHQGAIEMFWLHFRGAVMSFIFMVNGTQTKSLTAFTSATSTRHLWLEKSKTREERFIREAEAQPYGAVLHC